MGQNRILKLSTSALFGIAFAMLGVVVTSPTTFAATKTWTGGSATIPRVWSDAANWAPAGAPVNGDDLVFNTGTPGGANDVVGLSIAGIVVNGTGPYQVGDTASNETLTLTGNVTSNIPVTSGGSGAVLFMSNITLGADVVMTNVKSIGDGDVGSSLNLNGHALSLVNDSTYTSSIGSVDSPITGTGVFNIDVKNGVSLFLENTSTYTGITNLISGQNAISGSPQDSNSQFGTSTINVSPTASLSLHADGGTWTFNNPINIAQAVVGSSGFLDSQLYIWSNVAGQQIAIPNITLNGNARFSVNPYLSDDTVRVNLAGIAANGHCVQYQNEDNTYASFFINGPAACVIGSAPGVPNTGFMPLVLGNPLVVVTAGIAAAGALLVIRRQFAQKN